MYIKIVDLSKIYIQDPKLPFPRNMSSKTVQDLQ